MSTRTIEREVTGAVLTGSWRWRISILLALVGLVDSIYLTWVKLANAYSSCIGIGDCEVVNQSRFAELWGQPIALYGALAYLAILVLLVSETLVNQMREWSTLAVFGLTMAGTLYSAYLTYLEIAVLRAICPYCVLSAVAMLGLWGIAIARVGQAAPDGD